MHYSKEFEKAFGDESFRYKGKKIPVRSLELGSDYIGVFCRHVASKYKWNIDDITYHKIFAISNIGEKKARAIAEALIKCGVIIRDIPEEVEVEPVRLVIIGPAAAECTNCHAVLTTNMDAAQQLYKYCPMCGRKFRGE